jgi:hypothetical protein
VRRVEDENLHRIIIEMEPFLAAGDVLGLRPQVDGKLLVVGEGLTRRDALRVRKKCFPGHSSASSAPPDPADAHSARQGCSLRNILLTFATPDSRGCSGSLRRALRRRFLIVRRVQTVAKDGGSHAGGVRHLDVARVARSRFASWRECNSLASFACA